MHSVSAQSILAAKPELNRGKINPFRGQNADIWWPSRIHGISKHEITLYKNTFFVKTLQKTGFPLSWMKRISQCCGVKGNPRKFLNPNLQVNVFYLTPNSATEIHAQLPNWPDTVSSKHYVLAWDFFRCILIYFREKKGRKIERLRIWLLMRSVKTPQIIFGQIEFLKRVLDVQAHF